MSFTGCRMGDTKISTKDKKTAISDSQAIAAEIPENTKIDMLQEVDLRTTYYPGSQTKSSEVTYMDSLPNGGYKFYHRNGILSEKCWVKNGYRDGVCKFYKQNGDLQRIVQFEKGKKIYEEFYKGDAISVKWVYDDLSLIHI